MGRAHDEPDGGDLTDPEGDSLWAGALVEVSERVNFVPLASVITASTRWGRADCESWSGRMETPGVMTRSSSRVGLSKRASNHSPSPGPLIPGPHHVLFSLSTTSSGA